MEDLPFIKVLINLTDKHKDAWMQELKNISHSSKEMQENFQTVEKYLMNNNECNYSPGSSMLAWSERWRLLKISNVKNLGFSAQAL